MALLEKILEWQNLTDAWDAVAENRGAPGVDQVSVQRFARFWAAHVFTLADLVRSNRYRPGRLRRVAIPKQGGGQRLLQIPTVGDRVLQRAVLNLLEAKFEPTFLDCSHGYRPRRGVRTALTQLLRLRDQGNRWVLDADIDACFDSIDHQLLMELVLPTIEDRRVIKLIEQWLALGIRQKTPNRGLALGMPTSPLLCNVFLHQLDWSLTKGRWALVRFADDFVVCCDSSRQAEEALEVVNHVLAGLKLRLEPSKTRVTSFGDGFEFLGIRFDHNTYSFTWQDKQIHVDGVAPDWLWNYTPEGYDPRGI